MTRSASRRRTAGVCAEATSRNDVNLPLQIATLDASIGRIASVGRTAGMGGIAEPWHEVRSLGCASRGDRAKVSVARVSRMLARVPFPVVAGLEREPIMPAKVRTLFWIEASLAGFCGALAVLTIFWQDWGA